MTAPNHQRPSAATLDVKRQEADESAEERDAALRLPLGDSPRPRGRDALREG